jgi:4-hydroxy-L-threonine phosphate dehydrogenase PdxA
MNTSMRSKPIVAIAAGDPVGIGPEIALKTALDPAVTDRCNPIVVCDPEVIERLAGEWSGTPTVTVIDEVADATWSDGVVTVLACRNTRAAALPYGKNNATAGRASLAFASRAIKSALDGEVDVVVAAPQNQTSISLAGIPFDGYPSFVARETRTDEREVNLMLCIEGAKFAHVTLHESTRDALDHVTQESVGRTIRAVRDALNRLGNASPRIGVGGLNPHAGEGGLFGNEEIEILTPAIDEARAEGIDVEGPFGPDTLAHRSGFDAFVVMLHDHGHIPAKLLSPQGVAGLTIGTPILFSSVGHGSGYDIVGKGIAEPKALVNAIKILASGPVGVA